MSTEHMLREYHSFAYLLSNWLAERHETPA